MGMASQALIVSPWGFDAHQIAVPTHIWVGEDDISIFYKHAPDILGTLVAQP